MQTVTSEIKGMSTDELESYIDYRYEAGAPQDELDALEITYAKRVTEEDLNITEDEPNMSEEIGLNGGNLELGLIEMYRRYLQPEGQRDGGMEIEDLIHNMRVNLEDAGFKAGGLKDITDSQILAAAKDVYEYRVNLIQRYKSRNKLSNLPSKLWGRKRVKTAGMALK